MPGHINPFIRPEMPLEDFTEAYHRFADDMFEALGDPSPAGKERTAAITSKMQQIATQNPRTYQAFMRKLCADTEVSE